MKRFELRIGKFQVSFGYIGKFGDMGLPLNNVYLWFFLYQLFKILLKYNFNMIKNSFFHEFHESKAGWFLVRSWSFLQISLKMSFWKKQMEHNCSGTDLKIISCFLRNEVCLRGGRRIMRLQKQIYGPQCIFTDTDMGS